MTKKAVIARHALPPVIARSGNDEAISYPGIAAPSARNDNKGEPPINNSKKGSQRQPFCRCREILHLQISVVAWFIRRICPINWATTFLNFALSFCFLIFELCFPGMSNPPYGGVELPFLKGDLEGFLYEVMRDTIKGKKLPHLEAV